MAVVARNTVRPGQNLVLAHEQFPSNVYPWRAPRGSTVRKYEWWCTEGASKRAEAWNARILEAIDRIRHWYLPAMYTGPTAPALTSDWHAGAESAPRSWLTARRASEPRPLTWSGSALTHWSSPPTSGCWGRTVGDGVLRAAL